MRETRINDIKLFKSEEVQEILDKCSFDAKRIYYLTDIPSGSERGGHAHKNLRQIITAPIGSFTVEFFDGIESREIRVDSPLNYLLVEPGLWREMREFSHGTICLVFASEYYEEEDYIRNINDYLNYKKSD